MDQQNVGVSYKIPSDFYIINHDGFQVIQDELTDFDLVIVDEAAVYKHHPPIGSSCFVSGSIKIQM